MWYNAFILRKSEMNYNTGFFIGSETLKPGKLRKNREGVYSFEPFEELREGQITELYVNATGDITIAAKPGVAYSEVKFTGITKDSLNRNRAPSSAEKTDEYLQPSELIRNDIKNWQCYTNAFLRPLKAYSIMCAINLSDENEIKELIKNGNINVVLEYSRPEVYYLDDILFEYYESYNSQIFADNPTFDDKVTIEYSITPEVNYIGIAASCFGSSDITRDFDKEAIKVYLKLSYKNTPRWRE